MSLAWATNERGSTDTAVAVSAGPSKVIQVFFYLQALDFLTTLIGLKLGISEASPFIRSLLRFGPAVAVAASKLAALLLAAACVKLNRARVLRYVNYWFAAVVVWNLVNILITR